MIGRTKPYLNEEIAGVPCQRCGAPSTQQWSACCLNGRNVAICTECDFMLNQMVLEFIRVPHKERRKILYRYALKMGLRIKRTVPNVRSR